MRDERCVEERRGWLVPDMVKSVLEPIFKTLDTIRSVMCTGELGWVGFLPCGAARSDATRQSGGITNKDKMKGGWDTRAWAYTAQVFDRYG